MRLTEVQQAWLDGHQGSGLQLSMRILAAVGRSSQAAGLIPVESAHVGVSASSLGTAGVDLLEKWVEDGVTFRVPTTTNVLSSPRMENQPALRARDAAPDLQNRILFAMERLGATMNCSCNPFLQGHRPRFGSSVAWSESATAPFINGVLGARTNREGATALASAVTGLTPAYGMHLRGERLAREWFHVEAPLADISDFHCLGAAVSAICGERIPVISGVRTDANEDELYALCAAIAACSSLAMVHLVGITPEAATLEDAAGTDFHEPRRIDAAALRVQRERWQEYALADTEIVVIGCPHASAAQLREVAACLAGARLATGRTLLVHTNTDVKEEVRLDGTLVVLQAAGVTVTAGLCIYAALQGLAAGTRLATNSAKMASAMASKGMLTRLANTADCVRSVTLAA